MKLRKSFLTTPGELRYGVRSAPVGIAYRTRLYFLIVAIRSALFAWFCFFLNNASFDSSGFATFKAVATTTQWGWMFLTVSLTSLLSAFLRSGAFGRFSMTVSGVTMIMLGSSFFASALQYGVGWWAAVAFITIGLVDFIVASYPGEVT